MNATVAPEFDAAQVARSLVRAGRRAALATLDADSGAPYVSLVATATAPDGAPLLLLSALARHTANLRKDARASLLFEDVASDDPLAGARVSVSGRVAEARDQSVRRRYLARHPGHAGFSAFGDFAFYRLEPEGAHLVAGFGRIESVPREALLTDLAGAEDLLAAEESAVAHLNDDHRETLALYATRLLGAQPGDWRCDGLDPAGLELSCGGRTLYLPFPEPARGSGPLRVLLRQLAETARGAG